MVKAFFLAIFGILAVMALFFLVFPVIGSLVVLSVSVTGVLIGTVIGFCVLIMAMFVVGGAAILGLSALAIVWFLLAIAFLPISIPILLPLLILLLFVTYARRQRKLIRN